MHGRAARAAEVQALLLRHAAGHEERFRVGDLHDFVDNAAVERHRPEVFADTLHQIRPAGTPRVHRARRIRADDLHRLAVLGVTLVRLQVLLGRVGRVRCPAIDEAQFAAQGRKPRDLGRVEQIVDFQEHGGRGRVKCYSAERNR